MIAQTTTTNLSQHSELATLKKIISIIFFLILFYAIPLAGKPDLLLHWKVIFMATTCAILFATQPRLSIEESKVKRGTDRNTIWFIIFVSGIGQIVSLLEWAYFPFYQTASVAFTITGIILLVSGTAFRLYAIHVLGKYFSSTVQIKDGHQIISCGPYKYLRHPSYTGAYMAMFGGALFLTSITGMLVFGIGMLWVYRLRINAEEQTLLQQFGEEYMNYSKRTWKMFPFIW